MISFDRPEMSPCLTRLKDQPKKYAKALAIIRLGQHRLKECPHADMPGFVPWKRDLRRQGHRDKYLTKEMGARKAIRQRRN